MTVFVILIDMFFGPRHGPGGVENVTLPRKITFLIVFIDVFSCPRRGPGRVENVTPFNQNDHFHSSY